MKYQKVDLTTFDSSFLQIESGNQFPVYQKYIGKETLEKLTSVVRETSVSRHHGCQIKCPPEISRT